MDITLLFRACVKTARTRSKAIGTSGDVDKGHNILSRKVCKSDFGIQANEVLSQITRLKDLLLEHRKAYLNFASHLSDTPQMSDFERDKIDTGAQEIMRTCAHLIKDFKREFQNLEGSLQLLEHYHAVLDLIEMYLKVVCKIYSEQRAIRLKRSLELQKLAKLELETRATDTDARSNASRTSPLSDGEDDSRAAARAATVAPSYVEDLDSVGRTESSLSAEEMQLFESENAQLYNELNSLTDEVRQIESKVVHIAELQEIFTEKVLQQEVDIDRIASTVVGTSENVNDANEQIRQAIQRNAGLRVWVLFFLLIMSFSLLFLDWYND